MLRLLTAAMMGCAVLAIFGEDAVPMSKDFDARTTKFEREARTSKFDIEARTAKLKARRAQAEFKKMTRIYEKRYARVKDKNPERAKRLARRHARKMEKLERKVDKLDAEAKMADAKAEWKAVKEAAKGKFDDFDEQEAKATYLQAKSVFEASKSKFGNESADEKAVKDAAKGRLDFNQRSKLEGKFDKPDPEAQT